MEKSPGPCPECPVQKAGADRKYLLLSALFLFSLITTAVLEALQPSLVRGIQRDILRLHLQSSHQPISEASEVTADPPAPLFRVPDWGHALVDRSNARPATVDFLFPEASVEEKALWSRIQCTGHRLNRTCLVENMYYFASEEQFVILLPSRTRLTGRVRSVSYKQKPVSLEDVGQAELVASALDGVKGDIGGIRLLMSNCSDYFKGETFMPRVLEKRGQVEAVAEELLASKAAQLGVPVDELDADVATEALLTLNAPDCPPQWPSASSACDCFDIRR
ncbi:hypothetical protein FOZ62_027536 [Perkinsus olseni]|uniref:Uncharacterized protein n=1 Tax=Perkinsus olseni TaxID=32597 RepID=A0A7J6QQ18_PEROL|nr:hypothetical protein FOZ62_027536 [Perkinsus olseni]